MSSNICPIPTGKPASPAIAPIPTWMTQADMRGPTGKQMRAALSDVPTDNINTLYDRAVSIQRSNPNLIVPFVERAEQMMAMEAQVERMYGVPRNRYTGRPVTLFPVTGMMVEAATNVVKRAIRIGSGITRGLCDGFKEHWGTDPMAAGRLRERLLKSHLLTVVLPPVFLSGVAVGLITDIVKTVTGIYDLITNFRKIADAAKKLLDELMNNEQAAYTLGKLLGKNLSGELFKLSHYNAFRFTFELGRIVGPILVYAVLAFTGIGATAATLRFSKELIQALQKFPRIKKLLDGLIEMGRKAVIVTQTSRRWIASAVDAGMPSRHFGVFRRVAGESNKIILVRQTNPKSVRWIEKEFPPKGKDLEFLKTSKETGLVTAKADELAKARNAVHKSSGKHYLVVDDGGKTASNARGDVIDLANADWPTRPGQVIDPVAKKPIPGDYDLMGVIDPTGTGRNLALVSSDGKMVGNFTNTHVKDIANRVNPGLDRPRVLHGAEEAYGNWGRIKPDDVIVGFYPDGTVMAYNRAGVVELYKTFGRELLDMKTVLEKMKTTN